MRRVIAALQVSADGHIEGPSGELDWAMPENEERWKAAVPVLDEADIIIVGRGAYPAYEDRWLRVLADPASASRHEVAYARFADRTPHVVLSRTLDEVRWRTARIARDADEIRRIKQQPGKHARVVGGATLVSSLLNLGLLDELHLLLSPVILGGGKPLFKDVRERRLLTLIRAKALPSGRVALTYGTHPGP